MGAEYKARSLLEKRLNDFGMDDRILLALAQIEYRSGRYDKSRQVLAKQSHSDLHSRILKLKIEIRSKSTLGKATEITKMLKQHPESEELFLLSAQWALKKGNISASERQVQKSLEINPEYAEAYFILSKIHDAQNDTTGAQWALRKALRLAPANLEIRLSYLHSLLDDGNWYEAEAQLKQYALNSDHPEVIYLKGLIAVEKRDDNLAEKLFLDAAKKQYAVKTETRLAEIEIRRGQFQSAEIRLQRISDFFPENLEIALTRAKLLMQTNRSSEIKLLLSPYLANKQGRGKVHLILAESQVQQGQTATALKTLAKAVNKWPRNPDIVQAYTFYLGISNRYKEAIPLLEEMQTFTHPYSRLFFFRLRAYYFMAGENEKFKTYRRRYQLEKNRVRRLF